MTYAEAAQILRRIAAAHQADSPRPATQEAQALKRSSARSMPSPSCTIRSRRRDLSDHRTSASRQSLPTGGLVALFAVSR